MKIMVLLWSTSVEKRIVALSLFIFYFFGPSFFYLSFLSLFYWDNALLNDDHHTSIYLQLNDYNSILEQGMTLYECLRRCTGMGNESRVTCMINYARWLRESWIRGCPDVRTMTFGRTPGLWRYKIEDFVPCPDRTFLGVEGKLGDTICRSPPIVTDSV